MSVALAGRNPVCSCNYQHEKGLSPSFDRRSGGAARGNCGRADTAGEPASTAPPPALPPFPGRTLETPAGLVQPPPVRDEPWSFAAGVTGAYQGNALFIGPSDNKQFSNSLYASIGRAWRLRRGDAQVGATATQAFYQDTASLNDFRYSVVAGLGHQITRRLTWSGNFSLSSGLARDSQLLTDAGVVLPSTTTAQSSTGSSTFNYALTRESNITWSLTTSGRRLFRRGLQWRNAADDDWRIYETGWPQSEYWCFWRLLTLVRRGSNVGCLWRLWQPGLYSTTKGWVVTASGGLRPYSVPTENSLRLTSAFNGGVTKTLRRNQTIGVMYSKSVEQTFGVNRANNLVQSVMANYGITLLRNLTASFAGTLAESQDPVDPDLSIVGQVAQGSLAYQALPNLSISVGTSVL